MSNKIDKYFNQDHVVFEQIVFGQIADPIFLDTFPELKELIESFDISDQDFQTEALKDFLFFATKYKGETPLKVKLVPTEQAPFKKYLLNDEQTDFLHSVARSIAVVEAVHYGIHESFFPKIEHFVKQYGDPEWVHNTKNKFYMSPITFMIEIMFTMDLE
jgi:hypothetical protein